MRRCPLYCKWSERAGRWEEERKIFHEGILTVKICKRLLGQNQLQIATGQGKSLEPIGIQGFLVAGAGFEPTTFGL
jgi:hypothetical protein